jgi:hypothetical protein
MDALATRRRNRAEALTLSDLLDRVVERGVVVSGDVVISLAGVDLIYLNVRLLLCSAERLSGSSEGAA